MNFKKKTKPQDPKKIQKKDDVLKSLYVLFGGRERVLGVFESNIFPIKNKDSAYLDSTPPNLKILTSRQMFQRLPIALAQVKAGNNSKIY